MAHVAARPYNAARTCRTHTAERAYGGRSHNPATTPAGRGERHRRVIEQVEDYAIFTLDNEGRVSTWNEGAERVLGFGEEEALGQSGAIIFTPEDRERLLGELRVLNETLEARVAERTEALRQSERRFSQIFHAGPVASCLTSVGDERFLDVNEAFLQLTGYTRGEVLGRSFVDLGMWSSK